MRSMRIACALFAAFYAYASESSAQSLVWRNDWYVQNTLQPPFNLTAASVASTPSGNVVVAIPDLNYYQFNIASIEPDGNVAWQIPFGYNSVDTTNPLTIATDFDGSVYAGGDDGPTAKIDSNGTIVWLRDFASGNFVQGSTAIYVGDCPTVSALDKATGETLWNTVLSTGKSCSVNLAVDASGDVYVSLTLAQDAGSDNFDYNDQILKLDAAGSLKWSVVLPLTSFDPIKLVGVSGDQLYTQAVDGSVSAYRIDDGLLVWQRGGLSPSLIVLGGSPASPIVLGEPAHKLSAVTGQDEWSETLSVGEASAFADGSDLYVGGNDIARVDGNTGAVLWTTQLTSADNYAAVTPGAGATVLMFGKRQSDASSHIDKIDKNTGQILTSVTVGSVSTGVLATDAVSDSTSIVQSATNHYYLYPTNYLRSVNKLSGATEWQLSYDAPQVFSGSLASGPYLALSSTDGIAAVSFAPYSYGGIWVAMFNRSDGSQRWAFEQDDYADDEQNVWASAPQTDSNGDVYVSYTAEVSCPPPMPACSPSSLIKFSKIDGSVIWRNDKVGSIGFYGYAAEFSLIGNDVIVAGPFSGSLAGNDAIRLSGTNGALTWAHSDGGDAFVYGLFVNNDGSVMLETDESLVVLDSTTGTLKWNESTASGCVTPECYVNSSLQLADGTVVGVGYDGALPLFYKQAFAKDSVAVYSHFDSKTALGRTILSALFEDDEATLWVRGATYFSDDLGLRYLSKLDPATPKLYDQQVLGIHGNDSFGDFLSPGLLEAPKANRLVTTTQSRQLGKPLTQGAAAYDMTIAAHGDLALETSTIDDAGTSHFTITMTYNGDTRILGAQVVFARSSPNPLLSLSCSVTLASNCSFGNANSDFMSAQFDIEPGGIVTVRGMVDTSGGLQSAPLHAVVFGPASLAEPDLMNNVSRIAIPDEIFADGFQ